jgi:FkbM family methyltransferase
MNLRREFKRWLYGSCPGRKGVLPYYGERIHFPLGSVIFELACAEGIFEHDNVKLLQASLRPNAWCFDVGANIGLMSAPLLETEPTVHVVSIEASPRTAEYLGRTIAGSPRRDRWHFVPKALGATEGEIEFHASVATHGVFDGIRNTGRGRGVEAVKVPLTTLDRLWTEFGRPEVCVVKIDVEGAEADVLRGASLCLQTTRPVLLIEWNTQNLAAYGTPPDALLEWADAAGYDVLIAPGLARVNSPAHLRLQMGLGETFMLVPRS